SRGSRPAPPGCRSGGGPARAGRGRRRRPGCAAGGPGPSSGGGDPRRQVPPVGPTPGGRPRGRAARAAARRKGGELTRAARGTECSAPGGTGEIGRPEADGGGLGGEALEEEGEQSGVATMQGLERFEEEAQAEGVGQEAHSGGRVTFR